MTVLYLTNNKISFFLYIIIQRLRHMYKSINNLPLFSSLVKKRGDSLCLKLACLLWLVSPPIFQVMNSKVTTDTLLKP